MTPKELSRLVWIHNSYSGQTVRIARCCENILNSATATIETKAIAQQIIDLSTPLLYSLKTRVKLESKK